MTVNRVNQPACISPAEKEYRQAEGPCLQAIGSGPSCRNFLLAVQPLYIGRDRRQCDILLNGAGVSRKHARIEPRDRDSYQLVDLQSTNGVYVNNRKINSPCRLTHNDIIGIGCPDTAHLRFCSSSARTQPLADIYPPQPSWTIGRSSDCDLCLPFVPTVSAHHATVYADKDCLTLVDESSLNGTWKNNKSIRRDQITAEDVIVIGSTELRFHLHVNGSLQVEKKHRSGNMRLSCSKLTCNAEKSKTGPPVLNSINVSFHPGELIGILGPSGAGKTTLLQALSGHIPPISGTVLVNDISLYETYEMFRNTIGYVPQDDILYPELRVETTLDYSAEIRLPHDISSRQRRDIVDSTIEALDLTHVRSNRIDQLSGGQRKRVSIGMELITRPGLLFLDEPTAGLDPSTELKLMHHFKTVANAGTTVIMTTHILDNLSLLDKIVLLARGELVFFGTPNEAMEFFQQQQDSISCPADIYHVLENRPQRDKAASRQRKSIARKATAIYYADQYNNSIYYQKHIGSKQPFCRRNGLITQQHPREHRFSSLSIDRPGHRFKKILRPSFSFKTWLTLSRRHCTIRLATPKRILTYVLIPILLALVTLSQHIQGFIDQETVETQRQSIQLQIKSGGPLLAKSIKTLLSPEGINDPRQAWEILHAVRFQGPANLPVPISILLMGIMTAVFLGTVAGCLEISSERRIYKRERMAGMHLVNYLGSKLPFCLFITAFQCLLFIGCCSLHPLLQPLSFLPIWLTMVVVTWTSVTMGLLISATDPTPGRFSVLLAVAVVLPQIILSGGTGPDFHAGMNGVCKNFAALLPARWGLEMGLSSVYGSNPETTVSWIPDFIHKVIGFDYGSTVYYHGFSVLAVQAVVWLLLCAWLLKRRDPI
jgi:ABC-type multidrug transport system ATPase subunit/ABC-type multidrug transport system permease subunit